MMADQMLDEITVTASRPVNPSPTGRQPRGLVKINGSVVPGWIIWNVQNNVYAQADTYTVTFSLTGLPSSNNAAWFSNQTEIFVELLAGFPKNPDAPVASELTSFIYGRVDDIEIDLVQRTLHLTGRDLTGCFIDAKIAEDYTNQTASQIATKLAQGHGLAYHVTTTTTKVGSYYNIDTTLLRAGRSEWDLLEYMARQEGFVVYVLGQTLWFAPDPTPDNTPYVLTYEPPTTGAANANFIGLNLSRSLTVAKGITVTVSAAGRANPTVRKSYPTAPKAITPGKSSPYGATTDYYYTLPAGSTPLQCQVEAEQRYNRIIQHEMKLTATLPGDNLLSTQSPINVTGTATAFDQTYFPKVVSRTMSKDEGYAMSVQAQSQNPNLSQAAPPPDTGGTMTAPSDDVTTGSDATSE